MYSYDPVKKRVMTARNSTHLKAREDECALDRLGAASLSSSGENRLGDMLWRLKYGQERGWRDLVRPVVLLLERKFQPPKRDKRKPKILLALIACALTEWIHDQCQKCGGRGKLGAGREVAVTMTAVCGSCGGKGRVFQPSPRFEAARLAGAIVGDEIPDVRLDKTCGECHGKGGRSHTRTRYSRLRSCPTCHDTGRLRMTDARRALEIGMPASTFAKWKPQYKAVLRELRAADLELAVRIDFRLSRGENPDDASSPVSSEQEYKLPGAESDEARSDTTGKVPLQESR
jgi:hypothetical protein